MQRILVPIDGSLHAKEALRVAIDLARARDARLVLLHVLLRGKEANEIDAMPESAKLDPATAQALRESLSGPVSRRNAATIMADPEAPSHPVSGDVLSALGEAILNTAIADAVGHGIVAEKTAPVDDEPAKAIVAAARAQTVSTIVMGSRGLGDIASFTFGSVSREVARHAPCPVVMVHAPGA